MILLSIILPVRPLLARVSLTRSSISLHGLSGATGSASASPAGLTEENGTGRASGTHSSATRESCQDWTEPAEKARNFSCLRCKPELRSCLAPAPAIRVFASLTLGPRERYRIPAGWFQSRPHRELHARPQNPQNRSSLPANGAELRDREIAPPVSLRGLMLTRSSEQLPCRDLLFTVCCWSPV